MWRLINICDNSTYTPTPQYPISAMAKGRGSKSTKLQAKRVGTAPKPAPSTEEVTEAKTPRHVSEALRQAVKDLGGDDDDLDLIAGIDDSENEDEFESKKGKKAEDTVDEVC
jgi:ribosome biogenesis protein MAK21